MRIIQIHNRYRQAGGEDVVAANESRVLRNAGHEVETFNESNPTAPFSSARRMVVSSWNPAPARRIRQAVETFAPDIAHVHNTWYSLTSSVIPEISKTKTPVVMTLHNYRMTCANGLLFRDGAPCQLCVGSTGWSGVRYRCYRNSIWASSAVAVANVVREKSGAWEHVDRFLALTHFAKNIYVEAGLSAERITVKPNFVSDPGSRQAPPSTGDTVLYVGRLSPEKGVDLLLRAWSRAGLADLRIRVIGDGPDLIRLKHEHPDVEFSGWKTPAEVRQEMLGARAIAFPSRWYEGQSIVMLEAMAAGLPILSSDWPTLRESLVGLEARWFRAVGDPQAWVDGLRILEDSESVDIAGSALRQRYAEKHSPEVGLRNLETVYKSVIARDQI